MKQTLLNLPWLCQYSRSSNAKTKCICLSFSLTCQGQQF